MLVFSFFIFFHFLVYISNINWIHKSYFPFLCRFILYNIHVYIVRCSKYPFGISTIIEDCLNIHWMIFYNNLVKIHRKFWRSKVYVRKCLAGMLWNIKLFIFNKRCFNFTQHEIIICQNLNEGWMQINIKSLSKTFHQTESWKTTIKSGG